MPPHNPPGDAGRDARPPHPREHQLMIGLGAGAALSLIVWGLGWNTIDRLHEPAANAVMVGVPGCKIVVGGVLLFVPRWRVLGAGILLSLALGVLIFFGSCFAHMKL